MVGERGVLIRGPSGAGKSALAFALIDEARARGRYGALVADDRVFLEAANGALIARGAAGFEGLIENRGEGVLRLPHEPEVVADLLVDLGPQGSGAAALSRGGCGMGVFSGGYDSQTCAGYGARSRSCGPRHVAPPWDCA